MNYRKLNESEIQQLIQQGCQADRWDSVEVVRDFLPNNVFQVHFSGDVKLGLFDSVVQIDPGVDRSAGLRNVFIKNCTVHNNAYIADIKSLVNYTIEENVILENVDRIMVDGETSFANGIKISVLNEAGGREVPIFDQLSSQIAYLLATYRHDQDFIRISQDLIQSYSESKKASTGTIGRDTKIIDCGEIRNVTIGPSAQIRGAAQLTEGTIASNEKAPVVIGSGVIAESFIILSGSKVDNAALLEKTFVGQGVQVGRQFSAENTLIFSNSECFHSEACSIFAGPYTVTHHKSTLLIAAMFSFYNAGSGSNQSNHMYKLGPVHQGILERGSKTGSLSYMIWPSRIGAFSVVIGKHYSNFDNTDLPFSYILESGGKTITIPALNFFTVGTKRDSVKWPKRDRRKDPNKYDILNFDLLSPYIVGKVLNAEKVLLTMAENHKDDEDLISFKGQYIETKRIKKALEDYSTIINLFIGEQLLKQLNTQSEKMTSEELIAGLKVDSPGHLSNWIDISGMICPSDKINSLTKKMDSGEIASIGDLRESLETINKNYDDLTWAWCVSLILSRYKIKWENLTFEIFTNILSTWQEAALEANERILEDAGKEFSEKSHIGYGIDGDQKVVDSDFENVIGNFDENDFVKDLKEESEEIKSTTKKMIDYLRSLK
jgi:NDP-sugar pyrophosphorylase family protein